MHITYSKIGQDARKELRSDGSYDFKSGDTFEFVVSCTSDPKSRLYMAIFSLQPDYEVSRLYPSSKDAVVCGKIRNGQPPDPPLRPIKLSIPEGHASGFVEDVFKCIVATEPFNLDRFIQGGIRKQDDRKERQRGDEPEDLLETFKEQLRGSGITMMNSKPIEGWMVSEIKTRTYKF